MFQVLIHIFQGIKFFKHKKKLKAVREYEYPIHIKFINRWSTCACKLFSNNETKYNYNITTYIKSTLHQIIINIYIPGLCHPKIEGIFTSNPFIVFWSFFSYFSHLRYPKKSIASTWLLILRKNYSKENINSVAVADINKE